MSELQGSDDWRSDARRRNLAELPDANGREITSPRTTPTGRTTDESRRGVQCRTPTSRIGTCRAQRRAVMLGTTVVTENTMPVCGS